MLEGIKKGAKISTYQIITREKVMDTITRKINLITFNTLMNKNHLSPREALNNSSDGEMTSMVIVNLCNCI